MTNQVFEEDVFYQGKVFMKNKDRQYPDFGYADTSHFTENTYCEK
jgi:hypothetical protein